ncbi:hypothetical protein LTR54_008477 [Friedmanniomyces endolithicus]|nr:hypothetical protein LTS00_003006 [Friedmanniomyces endolithicus]KAK0310651.1 hypothetical protein LTR01_003805 [Friedmanniomyces endolithicus]KAK1001580.1 hypothetical protein LTR54_008477 [Friedmanniomyces endolithicus]
MAGDLPWPEVPIGNKNHANAAVVIIGAGIAGMCTAIDLIKRNNCRNFIVLEKSAGLGGTWHDNKYPGCCCDVLSTLYSYSFAQNSDWTREYPGQEEILAYLIRVAQEYKLYPHIRFNTTVEEARWDDELKKWRTKVTTPKGSKEAEFSPEYEIKSDFLVSAVGQLNQPAWPKIQGLDEFSGKKMHSARWDWSYDLADKKIALIGNGCTAVQILPEIAKVAKQVTVFQRTPNWVVPRLDQPVSPFMRNVLRYVPPIRWRKRAGQMDFREWSYQAIVDSKSAPATMFRDMAIDMMHKQLPDQPEMWEKLTPNYSLGCKRIIISDDYFPALDLPNVDLETRPIHSINDHSVKVTATNGEPEDAGSTYDLLVCATGFQTLEFLHPINLYGENGRSLRDVWKNGARSFNGTCVEDMPNFGILYGPNTNLGHNSIILMIESQSRYINGLIKPVLEARRRGEGLSLAPRVERVEAYNEEVQRVLKESSFNVRMRAVVCGLMLEAHADCRQDPSCNSWYKNEAGLITNNWSGTVVEYQQMLSRVDYDDYDAEGSGAAIVREKRSHTVGRVVEESQVSDTTLMVMGLLSTAAVVGGFLFRNPRYLSGLRVR